MGSRYLAHDCDWPSLNLQSMHCVVKPSTAKRFGDALPINTFSCSPYQALVTISAVDCHTAFATFLVTWLVVDAVVALISVARNWRQSMTSRSESF